MRRCGNIEALYGYDGALARAVAALKFDGDVAVAGPLGRLLADAPILKERPSGRPWDFIVPVPLHRRRAWIRGYNQSMLLARWMILHGARSLARPLPELRPDLLVRTRATAAQTELDGAHRRANLAGAFLVPDPAAIRGRSVLLIDDVTTTGATMHACMQALVEAGVRALGGLALLRSD
jgi:ComF family protein